MQNSFAEFGALALNAQGCTVLWQRPINDHPMDYNHRICIQQASSADDGVYIPAVDIVVTGRVALMTLRDAIDEALYHRHNIVQNPFAADLNAKPQVDKFVANNHPDVVTFGPEPATAMTAEEAAAIERIKATTDINTFPSIVSSLRDGKLCDNNGTPFDRIHRAMLVRIWELQGRNVVVV